MRCVHWSGNSPGRLGNIIMQLQYAKWGADNTFYPSTDMQNKTSFTLHVSSLYLNLGLASIQPKLLIDTASLPIMRSLTFWLFASVLVSPTPASHAERGYYRSVEDATSEGSFKNKHCKLVSSVTYQDSWGPLFTENDYECDLPLLSSHTPKRRYEIPILKVTPYDFPQHPKSNAQKESLLDLTSTLPKDKHQIISYGCAALPDPQPLDPTKLSSLFYTIPQLTNQSCILPGHLKEYKEVHKPWNARWAFTNYNRGKEMICDWYQELAQVGNALDKYCEHSLERKEVEGKLGEILAYGRDREREEEGGAQLWCVRYSTRGWKEKAFEEKCLGVGLEQKEGGEEEL